MYRKPPLIALLRRLDMALSGTDVRASTRNLVVAKMHGDSAIVQHGPLEFLRRRLESSRHLIEIHPTTWPMPRIRMVPRKLQGAS